MRKLFIAFNKVDRCILSCETIEQLNTANVMSYLFANQFSHYYDDFVSSLFNKLQGRINDQLYSILNKPTTSEAKIRCPNCTAVETAKIEYTFPFFTYLHHCSQCSYVITESQWTPL